MAVFFVYATAFLVLSTIFFSAVDAQCGNRCQARGLMPVLDLVIIGRQVRSKDV